MENVVNFTRGRRSANTNTAIDSGATPAPASGNLFVTEKLDRAQAREMIRQDIKDGKFRFVGTPTSFLALAELPEGDENATTGKGIPTGDIFRRQNVADDNYSYFVQMRVTFDLPSGQKSGMVRVNLGVLYDVEEDTLAQPDDTDFDTIFDMIDKKEEMALWGSNRGVLSFNGQRYCPVFVGL